MKALFDNVSDKCSKLTTLQYSTSFSLGIKFLSKKFHNPIYGIYGFVRFADEIVDTFHDYDKRKLLNKFKDDTWDAIEMGISLNPILNSFQDVVRKYGIERELIETFLDSMEMDLEKKFYHKELYQQYILGSAEVVGLMCLRVFCEGDKELYEKLKHPAMKLGSAFQKVNFLRDIRQDSVELGRNYFPEIDLSAFSADDKVRIEEEIEEEFSVALEGIKNLPGSSRSGVYLAYYYYFSLFNKIKALPASRIMAERVRIPDTEKIGLMFNSIIRYRLNRL
jgi:15-cis-phytoene synthase